MNNFNAVSIYVFKVGMGNVDMYWTIEIERDEFRNWREAVLHFLNVDNMNDKNECVLIGKSWENLVWKTAGDI